jgi:hypothetical protein
MSTSHFQPEIRPQRTLGSSPFRFERSELFLTSVKAGRQVAALISSPFSPIAAENLWSNQPSRSQHGRRKQTFPVVIASGRVITQNEIDDGTGRGDSPVVNLSARGANPRLADRESHCAVLIEGVEEPLSLDDALAIAANWDAVNERRVRLIEKKAVGQITEQESAELQHLQRLAWAKRQMIMPLPLKELAAIEEALRKMQLWQDE